VNEERNSILVEDASYPLSQIESLISKEDTFYPQKRFYQLRYALASNFCLKVKDYLSDKGECEGDDVTNTLKVVDVEKNLSVIDNLVKNEDTLKKQVVSNINFKDTSLPDALSEISVKSGISIVVEKDVKGKITVSFEKPIPILKALDVLLKGNNCKYEIEDNLIKVKVIVSLLKEKTFLLTCALASSIEDSVSSFLSPQGTLIISPENNLIQVKDVAGVIEKIDKFISRVDNPASQMQTKSFPLIYALVRDVEEVLKENISPEGNLKVDIASNSILIKDTSYNISKLSSLIANLDKFQPEQKIFQLRFATSSDILPLIKPNLSSKGSVSLPKGNKIVVVDSPLYLERVKDYIVSLDKFSLWLEKKEFVIHYLPLKKTALEVKSYLSSEGSLGVNEERNSILVEDASYPLSQIESLISKEDTFYPQKRLYQLRYALASNLCLKVKDYLSDKGECEGDEVTNTLKVVDVKKNLSVIDNLIENEDTLEKQLMAKKYTLLYFTPEEAKAILEGVVSEQGKVTIFSPGKKETDKEKDYILIPQEGETNQTNPEKEESSSFYFDSEQVNVIYVTDVKKNLFHIDKLVEELNSPTLGSQLATRTFYIKEGSLENIATAIANIIGVSPEEIEGLQAKKSKWMEMQLGTPSIDVGNIGAIGKRK